MTSHKLYCILFLFLSLKYASSYNLEDIANYLSNDVLTNVTLPKENLDLMKQISDITQRSTLPASRRLNQIKPVMVKLFNLMRGPGNEHVSDEQVWEFHRPRYEKLIKGYDDFLKQVKAQKDSVEILDLNSEVSNLMFNLEIYSLDKATIRLKYETILRRYPKDLVDKWHQIKSDLADGRVPLLEMAKPKHSPMSDSNDNDAPITDVSPVVTPVKTSKNGLRTVPISFESQAILYLFPQKHHRGTAKVIHFYRKDICYILSGDEACHQNIFARSCKSCIDYTPWSAVTYLPPDWCICFSDESDCSGYNACWENFGYPVDLSYDGFKHIRSISILSGPVCKAYHLKRLSRMPTSDIKGLECHPTRQNNTIGDGSDDYSMVQSPNLPSPYIRPNHNHMILQLFDRKSHTGKGTVFNFFKGDVCYNIKTCNITSPSSAYVYAPECWSVCFSKDEDCKGLTKCWPNHGWPIDLHYDGLAGLKSFAIYDTGCYEFNRFNITETRTSKIAESCV
ncbi:hypothetical protein WR25_09140 isoform A [Diploscapter pachys]|uniref:Uncharacterized protein n=2 Tax=Diploscapter pachys TaxID=2018661 RepID=A0A2A2LIC9_9BILA|nr:hypothetical protein WR25_09140 isoform A [Diploscapter pachys]